MLAAAESGQTTDLHRTLGDENFSHENAARVIVRESVRKRVGPAGSSSSNEPGAWSLYRLSRGVPRRPGPLEVVPAQPARYIHDFADEMQAGHTTSPHCLG